MTAKTLPTFEEKTRSGYYESLITVEYSKATRTLYREQSWAAEETFRQDARAYAIAEGVPEKYVTKVVAHAWSEGHANGYTEVLCHLETLIEIFQEN